MRDIKDEGQMQQQMPEGTPQTAMPTMNSIQIQATPEMEIALVEIVKADYEAGKEARDRREYGRNSKGESISFERHIKDIRDLYNANREPKSLPWKFCSNRSLRIAASIIDMLHSRLFPAIVNEDLLRWKPGEISDVPKVERISKLMHWWIWVNSRLRTFFDNWTKVCIGYGETISESWHQVTPVDTGENDQTPITDELGNPQMNPDGTPAVSTTRRIRLDEKGASKIYMPDQYILQKGSRDIQSEPVILEDEYLYRVLEDGEVEGKFVNISNLLKAKIQFDKTSVAGLDEGTAERIQNIRIRNYPVKVWKWYGNFDSDGDGFAENVRILICPDYDLYISGIQVRNLTKSGKRPIDFSKYDSRLNNVEENWGEGVLEKVKEMAFEVDAIFNQISDSNTLSILRPGFYDPSGDVDAPAINLSPNRMTAVSDPSRNVYFPDLQINIERLIMAIRLVLEFIERLTAASSYVMGKESEIVGGSGTATRTNAIMSSAEQRFALPAERLREGAARIITQHLDLLQLNIPPGLENRILGEDNKPVFDQNELVAEGISGQFDAYLLMDPTMGSMSTERELASMMYSLLLQNIIVGTDPQKIYKITADLIKAYGKDPEEYLGPEPDRDMIDSPEEENTLVIQGDFGRVKAQITENHILHIQKHMELLQSPSLAIIPPAMLAQVQQFMQQHIQEHTQMMQTMQAIVAKFGAKQGALNESSQGTETGGNPPSQGNPNQQGMANTSGPLAGAMQTKREGESFGAS